MLSERERRMLAQIEAHIRRDEPTLAHLLAHGTRLTLLRHPEPMIVRALALTALTVTLGIALLTMGIGLGQTPLLVGGLAVAVIGPLPAWLLATSGRAPARVRA